MGRLRAIALASILAPAAALAQPGPPPTPQQKQQAGDLVKKAIAKSQSGDHQGAIDLYLQAYNIIPQPLLLSNIGSEFQQLKKPIEALKYFCKYIEADGPMGNNVPYALAQARTLYIELGGVPTAKDDELCKPIVKPAAPPPPPDPGNGSGNSLPGPAPGGPSPGAGPSDPGGKTSPLRLAGYGIGGVGVIAFGAGVYFGLKAKSISDEITNHDVTQPWGADIKQKEKEGEDAEKKQVALMIGGGVAVAAGIAMILLGGSSKTSTEQVTITPIATTDSVGFAAAGRF